MIDEFPFPKLRAVQAHAIVHGGRPSVLLRDPLRLSGRTVVVPRVLAPVLALFDGSRGPRAMAEALALRFGFQPEIDSIDQLVGVLDEACLLENARSREAQAAALECYRKAPFRPPAMAGGVYPADPGDLRRMLDGYLAAAPGAGPSPDARLESGVRPGGARGLFSPHIDYARGGPVYARVWKRAADIANDADVFVVFGTDHFGESGRITLTRQHYATPFGVMETDGAAVDRLADAIGADHAFGGELRHRDEHAIELVLVWLHHLRGGRPCVVIPILCGGFGHFVRGDAAPRSDATFDALLGTLRDVTAGRNVAVVVSGDLAHVGPAFGGDAVDGGERGEDWRCVRAVDDAAVAGLCAGDAEAFYGAIAATGDATNICGLSPGYLALRYLALMRGGTAATGEAVGYARCPADDDGASWVSVGGVVWT